MPNRYLGRDLANQRYLGRDVSSIRSFGRIVYEATVVDNALDLFRAGVAAVDTLALTSLTAASVAPFISLNSDSTTSLQADDLLSTTSAWAGSTGASNTFLNDRTPIGSFVLLWRDDQNFALFEVDSHFSGLPFVDEVSVEAMVAVGTAGSGPATIYVFTDTAAFLRSVERVNGVWRPREFTRIVFSDVFNIPFNTTTNRYEPEVVGGDGVLRYAWTIEAEGKIFRLDRNTAVPGTTGQSRLYLNGTESLPNVDGFESFRIFDDNQAIRSVLPSGFGDFRLSNVSGDDIWLSNWEDPEGVISVDANAPAGTVVTSVAVGSDSTPNSYSWSFSGDLAEYSPYTFNGEGDYSGAIISPASTYDITKISSDVIPLAGDDISQFAVAIFVDTELSIQDISITINR